jgi:hypothetical protein
MVMSKSVISIVCPYCKTYNISAEANLMRCHKPGSEAMISCVNSKCKELFLACWNSEIVWNTRKRVKDNVSKT